MDYSGNIVHAIPGNGSENWMATDSSADWATEDDYRAWNSKLDGSGEVTPSNSSYQSSQSLSGSEPPTKKVKHNPQEPPSSKKSIGKMFFKTKLCCKFRAGTCPYVTNCNFAHSIEELRRPPSNWQEIVAAHDEDRGNAGEIREEFQIPSIGGFSGETQRSYKGRHCKKFYTEEGCPYGDNCTFLHDELSKNRESVAISLGPGGYGGGVGGSIGGGSGGGAVTIVAGGTSSTSSVNSKPSNWKTRICNKWELTGYCPFGSKCHFAHGVAELHRYGGGLVESEMKDQLSTPSDAKLPGVSTKGVSDSVTTSVVAGAPSDVYHMTVPSQRTPSISLPRPGQRTHQKWKGPDKISRIYGDWIDDIE